MTSLLKGLEFEDTCGGGGGGGGKAKFHLHE